MMMEQQPLMEVRCTGRDGTCGRLLLRIDFRALKPGHLLEKKCERCGESIILIGT